MKLFRYARYLLVAMGLVLGCNQSGSTPPPAAETKPAAAPAPALPPGHPDISGQTQALPTGHPTIDMSAQQLPPGATASDVTNPQWVVPPDWQPGKQSSMRRASYVVNGAEGHSAEIAVSVFPGDVGGLLANVNRWRGQLGLEPATAEQLAGLVQKLDVPGSAATMVDFTNAATGKRLLVATISQGGNSWFFKMTGDQAVVAAQQVAFLNFVKSVKF